MLHAAVAPSLPASAVTHSVTGNFSEGLPDGVKELLIFKKNYVELWRTEMCTGGDKPLAFVTSTQLNAPPACVAVCRPPGFPVDVIAMCFDDFHVSFVMYNPVLMRFRTLLLVQLDDREVSHVMTPLDPIMRAHSSGKYIVVLARRHHLFFLPLLGPTNPGNMPTSDSGEMEEAVIDSAGAGDAKPAATPVGDWGDEDDYDEDDTKQRAIADDGVVQKEALPEQNNCKTVFLSGTLLRLGTISMFTLSKTVKNTLRYVRDLQFVGSSGEPLLGVLCERRPTWAGRVKLVEWRTKAVDTNTLSMQVAWVQISGALTTHPKLLLVGEVDSVPYNVTHMIPVESSSQTPSGVICFGINTVMHITTKRGYGVYFNSTGMEECGSNKSSAMSYGKMSWCDAKLESSTALFRVNFSLANCTATIFSPRSSDSLQILAVSEEDGVVAVLEFLSQGANVHDIQISVLASGCYCSSLTPISDNLFFLGSAVSFSCIASITPTNSGAIGKFKVVESIEAIGSIRDVDVVDCSNDAADCISGPRGNQSNSSWLEDTPFAELAGNTTLDPMPNLSVAQRRAIMDLAVCAGNGSAGCVFILRQSVRNSVVRREKVNAVSAFLLELPPNGKRSRAEEEQEEENRIPTNALSRLLLSGTCFTIPFIVRGESVQHERHSEFVVTSRTVYAAGIPWLGALLQLTESEVRIVSFNARKLLQRFTFFEERQLDGVKLAKSGCLVPEHKALFVLLDDGTMLLFTLKNESSAPKKTVFADNVMAFALWCDPDYVIMFLSNLTMVIKHINTGKIYGEFPRMGALPPYSVLGDSTVEVAADETKEPSAATETIPHVTHVEVLKLSEGPATEGTDTVVATALAVVLSSGELAVYHVMKPDTFGSLRFIKAVHHFLDTRAVREVIESIEARKCRLQRERTMIENDTQSTRHCARRIIPFACVAGQSGAYVCGQHPVFLLWDKRKRRIAAYRHQSPGAVRGFVSFPQMAGGFIYCCEGFVDFARMNTYCAPNGQGWLTRRIAIGATPHFLVYDPPGKSCFVVTSEKKTFRPQRAFFDVQLKIHYDEELNTVQSVTAEPPVCHMPPINPGAGVRVPMVEQFEVRLLSTTGEQWECTHKFALEENEKVLGAQAVELRQDEAIAGAPSAPVCVLCTAFPLGEDVTCRGRIILLASKTVKKKRAIVQLHSEPLNGPATAVTGICSQIAVAVGGTIKIFRYDWETKKLVVSAFLYAGVYATRLSAFRNYIIYGDLCRSCAMARFNEQNHTLTVLGKDHNAVSVVHCDMMYHDRTFGILCSNDQRDLLLMGYTPRVQESGEHTPSRVLESPFSLDGEYRLPSGCLAKSLRFRSAAGNSSVTVYISNYGEVGFIVPLGEQANRTALWITRRLQVDLPCDAGLTPRMFLSLSQGTPRTTLRGKEMLVSAPLVQGLFFLDVHSRKAIARAAYTQLDRVINVAALIYEESALF
uniref:Uncharacterized protein TCIL3000_11_14840 n=1 Tax=Trypanosoma congolense (strain IL3000) TaxID=1068625 RepID=G0V2U5_TRYCI|nr:unnamed protein product [Trypanosoma congolense IL3000]